MAMPRWRQGGSVIPVAASITACPQCRCAGVKGSDNGAGASQSRE